MNDRLKWRMWSTHAGRYFDETNDAMLENAAGGGLFEYCRDTTKKIAIGLQDWIDG